MGFALGRQSSIANILKFNLVSGCSDEKANLRSPLVARLSVLLMQISTRLWSREKTNSPHLYAQFLLLIKNINFSLIQHRSWVDAHNSHQNHHSLDLNNYFHPPEAVLFSTTGSPKYHIQHYMFEAYHDMACISLSQQELSLQKKVIPSSKGVKRKQSK